MGFSFDILNWVMGNLEGGDGSVAPYIAAVEDSMLLNFRSDFTYVPVPMLKQAQGLIDGLLEHQQVLFLTEPDKLLPQFFIHPDRKTRLYQQHIDFGNPVETQYIASVIDFHTPNDGWLLVRYVSLEENRFRVLGYFIVPEEIELTHCVRNYLIDRFLAPM